MSARHRTPKQRLDHEETAIRRALVRRWKRRVRQADRRGHHDDAPRFVRTQGWVSW